MSKNNILTIITGSVVAVVIIATVAIIIKDSRDKKADTFTPVKIEQEAVTDADLSDSAVSIEEGENAGSVAADGNSTGDVDDSKDSDASKASSSKKDSSFIGETAIIGDDGKPVVLPASKQATTEGQTEANDTTTASSEVKSEVKDNSTSEVKGEVKVDHTGNSSADEPADYFDASDGQVIQTPKIRIK